MHRWTRFFLPWKLLFGVFLPACFLAVALAFDTPLRAIGAVALVAAALSVGYLFIRFANEGA